MMRRVESGSLTLRSKFNIVVDDNAERQAIVFKTRAITYGDLGNQANRLARYLISRGVGPGSIVPIAFERSPEMIVAMMAIILAGGAYLPLDIDSPTSRINDILSDSRATDILTSASVVANIAFNGGLSVHVIDDGAFQAKLSEYPCQPVVDSELIRPLLPDDAPYVIYTSGTTGKPKGVVNTHAGVVNSLAWMAATLDLTPDDRCLLKAPYTFDLSVWEIFVPLTLGGCLVIAEPGGHRDPAYLCERIISGGVTLLYFVPTMLGDLIGHEGTKRATGLRNVVAIGEALTGHLQKRVHDTLAETTLWNSYGPTEAAVGVTLWRCRREDGDLAPPLGAAAWNTDIYLLDTDLNPTAVGVSGELFIAGIQVAKGYLEQPGLTRERFVPCPFGPPGSRMYRTGDFGERRPDGDITFHGRQDGQVKLNGIRIELGEIEASIACLPGVSKNAVVARKLQNSTVLVAYLVMRPGVAPMDGAELSERLVALLPGYMIPSLVVALDELPLTTSGKLDAKALPEPTAAFKATAYREPAPGLEAIIASLYAELTDFSPVGADHSFFELGGTSLMAMRLATRLKAQAGLLLPMRALVESPTPAGLAAVLRRSGPYGDRSRAGDAPLFVFPGAGGDDLELASLCLKCATTFDVRPVLYPDWRTLHRTRGTFDDLIDRMYSIVDAAVPAGGTIRLAGYSLGGNVAYGVAKRLEAAGRPVSFLGLIDTEASGSVPEDKQAAGGPTTPDTGSLMRLWRKGWQVERLGQKVLTRLPPSAMSMMARVMASAFDKGFEPESARRILIAMQNAWKRRLLSGAAGAKLNAPTHLFQCQPVPSYASFEGWPERCANLTVIPIKGSHFTVLHPDHIDDFARKFIQTVRQTLNPVRLLNSA